MVGMGSTWLLTCSTKSTTVASMWFGDFWKDRHPIDVHSKYIENSFFSFIFGEELFHKIPRKAFIFPSLILHLANDLCIYSHDMWHLFNKSYSFSLLPKDFVGIRCSYPKQSCVLFNSRSHIFLVKGESFIWRILKWHNSLNQLFIHLNGK